MKSHDLWSFLATCLGIGNIPIAPGTFGSLFALLIYIVLPQRFMGLGAMPLNLLALAMLCLVAVFICTKAEQKLGKDAPAIVLDEVCGYFVAVILFPKTWMVGLLAFVFFRIFDIAKPYPIGRSQKLPAGWGVVVDDLLAGAAAALLIGILYLYYPQVLYLI